MAKTANVGRVSVSLVSDTAQYVEKLKKAQEQTNKKLKKIEKDFNSLSSKTSASVNNISGNVAKFAKGMGGAAAAVAATTAAIAAFTAQTAYMSRDVGNLARQMGMTADEFQRVEFAAKQYGLTGEQISDITKDITDKVQEFSTDATGAFGDFAAELGLTKEEAQSLAGEMVNLTGEQQIGFMIRKLEEAGLSGREMTWALESMGNDLSKITPLFQDNGKELDRLNDKYDQLTTFIDKDAQKNLGLYTEQLDLLGTNIKNMAINYVGAAIKPFTDLTEAVNNFFAAMQEGTASYDHNRMAELRDEIKEIDTALENAKTASGRFKNVLAFQSNDVEFLKQQRAAAVAEYEKIRKSRASITQGTKSGTRDTDTVKKPPKVGEKLGEGSTAGNLFPVMDVTGMQKAFDQQEAIERDHNERMYQLRLAAETDDATRKQMMRDKEMRDLEAHYLKIGATEDQFREAQNALKDKWKAKDVKSDEKTFNLKEALASGSILKMLGMNKAAAVQDAIISGFQAQAQAWKLPFPANLGAAALAAVETGVILAGIKGVNIGQFHNGTNSVPSEGSYLLQEGERVIQPKANKDLTNYLKSGSNKSITINAPLNVSGNVTDQTWFANELMNQRELITAAVNKTQQENPTR